MPFIRAECAQFVQQWNVHKIRVQKERPHVTSGQPWDLYENPKEPATEQLVVPDAEVVDKLARELEAYDIDEYLPPDTLAWCRQTMLDQGHDPEKLIPGDVIHEERGARLHPRIYMELQTAIQHHIASGQTPILGATDPLLGGWAWKSSDAAVHAFESTRRNEEREESADQMTHDIRV